MASLAYVTGEDIRAGDRIRYHGDPGHVEFVVTARTGDPTQDWFIDEFPGGGAMICAERFGSVFLGLDDVHDFLELVARSENKA